MRTIATTLVAMLAVLVAGCGGDPRDNQVPGEAAIETAGGGDREGGGGGDPEGGGSGHRRPAGWHAAIRCNDDWVQGYLVGWFQREWPEGILTSMREDLGIENTENAGHFTGQEFAIVVDPKATCEATLYGRMPAPLGKLEPNARALATIEYRVYVTVNGSPYVELQAMTLHYASATAAVAGKPSNADSSAAREVPDCKDDWAQGYLVGWFQREWPTSAASLMRDFGIDATEEVSNLANQRFAIAAIVVREDRADSKAICGAWMRGRMPFEQRELNLARIGYEAYLTDNGSPYVKLQGMKMTCLPAPMAIAQGGKNRYWCESMTYPHDPSFKVETR